MTGCATPALTVRGVPNKPATPSRSIRISDDVWELLRRIADERGESVTEVVRRAIGQYLRNYPASEDT